MRRNYYLYHTAIIFLLSLIIIMCLIPMNFNPCELLLTVCSYIRRCLPHLKVLKSERIHETSVHVVIDTVIFIRIIYFIFNEFL